MQVRLYFDEDAMKGALVRALRTRSVDVLTAGEAARRHQSDAAHLAFASEQGRAIYSFNSGDYQQLHSTYVAQGISHAGIILTRQQRYSVGEQMHRLLRLINTVSAEEMLHRIGFLSTWE